MKFANTILAVPSDMHTGSSTALFPSKGFTNFEGNPVLPNQKQREIHPIYTRFAGEVAQARKGKRLVVVNLGDAIDGFHHNSLQESLFLQKDQCDAHIELMEYFLKRVGFNKKTDALAYVKGTESHVGESERSIAKELGAEIHDILEMEINGTRHLFAHHGKKRGNGPNEGNALRNHLRDIRVERERDGLPRLDVSWSGHTHAFTWNTHVDRVKGGQFHEFHGVICPSFQNKTRFSYGVVPTAVNSVGAVYMQIDVDGTIHKPKFVVEPSRDS